MSTSLPQLDHSSGATVPGAPDLPPIVSREEWRRAREALLAREKEATRLRDAVNAERRRMPMVQIDQDYRFDGPQGSLSLLDLFEGRRQLYVHHFMWLDALDTGCPTCSTAADINFDSPHLLAQLHDRDVTFVAIARAPWPRLSSFIDEMGWSFPFYSSFGSTFNVDLQVTLDAARAPIEYNYRGRDALVASGVPEAFLGGDWPGNSVFLRDGSRVFHSYSAYARGLDQLFTPYNFLDLTPYGRQESWEESPPGWPQRPTYG